RTLPVVAAYTEPGKEQRAAAEGGEPATYGSSIVPPRPGDHRVVPRAIDTRSADRPLLLRRRQWERRAAPVRPARDPAGRIPWNGAGRGAGIGVDLSRISGAAARGFSKGGRIRRSRRRRLCAQQPDRSGGAVGSDAYRSDRS